MKAGLTALPLGLSLVLGSASALAGDALSVASLEARLKEPLTARERLATLRRLSERLEDADPARARRFAQRGADLARRLGDALEQARMVRVIGGTYMLQSEHERALQQFELALSLCGADGPCLGAAYANVALIYLGRGQYLAGTTALTKATAACRDAVDRECRATLVTVQRCRALQYQRSGQFAEALEAAEAAVAQGQAAGLRVSRALLLVAKSLAGLDRPADALDAARRAGAAGRAENRWSVVGSALVFEADQLIELGRPDEGLLRLGEAREVFTSLSKARGLFNVELGAARAYATVGRVDDARRHMSAALAIAEGRQLNPISYDEANRLQLVLDILEGRPEDALASLARRDAYNQRMYEERFSTAMANAYAELDTFRREAEYEGLQHADAVKSLRLSRQRALLVAAALLIAVMVFMGLLLARALRRLRRSNAQLAAQKVALSGLTDALSHRVEERESLLREINHRVNGNLQVVTSLIRVQAGRLNAGTPAQEHVRQLMRDLERRIEAVSLVHRELYSGETLGAVEIGELFDRICGHLRIVFGYEGLLEVLVEGGEDELTLAIERAVPAALITCELVSNALEHAFSAEADLTDASPPRVEVRVWRDERPRPTLSIQVRDTGPGAGPPPKPSNEGSFGLRLVHQLTEQLRGTFQISRSPGGRPGVEARVCFPLGPEAPELGALGPRRGISRPRSRPHGAGVGMPPAYSRTLS